MSISGRSDEDEDFIQAIKALNDLQRAELYRQVKSTEVAYACPEAQRTDEQNVLVHEHDLWKSATHE
jgi:hypothetical protein